MFKSMYLNGQTVYPRNSLASTWKKVCHDCAFALRLIERYITKRNRVDGKIFCAVWKEEYGANGILCRYIDKKNVHTSHLGTIWKTKFSLFDNVEQTEGIEFSLIKNGKVCHTWYWEF